MKKTLLILIASLCMKIVFSQDCTIACYNFNANANDNSGNGNHALVSGATLTSDRFGNPNSAYLFDGIDDYIEIGDIDLKGNFSISAWAFNNAPYGLKQAVVDKWPDWRLVGEDGSGEPWLASGGIEFGMENTNRFGAGHVTNSTGSWKHIVAVFDSIAGVMLLYIDGKVVGTDIFSGTRNFNDSSIYIGMKTSMETSSFFNGKIDDVMLFNCALSSLEIAQLYDCGVVSEFVSSDTVICISESINFTNKTCGALSYRWVDNGVTFANTRNTSKTFTTPGNHQIQLISDNGGCLDTSGFNVVVNSLPDIITSGNTQIFKGDTIQLFAIGGDSYVWSPNLGLSNPNIANPIAFPDTTTNYTVTVTSTIGCVNSETITVTVDRTVGYKKTASNNIKVSIHPNPHFDWFELKGQKPLFGLLKIVNLLGKTVYQRTLNGELKLRIELNSNLPKGIYLVHINNEDQSLTYKVLRE